jgi:hypothetical protein
MRRWKRTWLLVALGTMGMMQTACGTGVYDLSCSVNKDCLESEICHPDQKLCVQICTTNAECPAEAKICKEISETNPQKICNCSTEECTNGETGP